MPLEPKIRILVHDCYILLVVLFNQIQFRPLWILDIENVLICFFGLSTYLQQILFYYLN